MGHLGRLAGQKGYGTWPGCPVLRMTQMGFVVLHRNHSSGSDFRGMCRPQIGPGLGDCKFTQCTYTGRDKVFPASQALLMLVRIGCQFEFETLDMTPSLWQVRPRPDGDHRIVSQTWEPPGPTHTYIDAYGNACDRVNLPPGRSVMRYDATVDVPSNPDKANEGAAAVA